MEVVIKCNRFKKPPFGVVFLFRIAENNLSPKSFQQVFSPFSLSSSDGFKGFFRLYK